MHLLKRRWFQAELDLGALAPDYRRHFHRIDVELASLAVGIGLASALALSYIDYLFYHLGPTFYGLLGLRGLFVGLSLIVVKALRSTGRPAAYDIWLCSWWLALFGLILFVDALRPATYVQNQVLYVLGTFVCYTVIPLPLWARLIPALALSAGDWLILLCLKAPLPGPNLQITVATTIITHVVGLLVSTRMETYRRQQYLAQAQAEQARLDLEKLATTDDLTGFVNRRRWLEMVDQELCRFRRYKHPFTLLMVDFDHFKGINDRLGHSAGDEVLRQFARQASDLKRCGDSLGRLGGEEFGVLLPETNVENAIVFAERLRARCAQIEVSTPQGVATVTISIGLAQAQPDEPSVQSLLQRSDAALYLAKRNGRNRCEVASVA
jgi:diguanylate cyclase (GGDEF)-like protein